MLDFKTQSQLVDATATVVRDYLRAATNTYAASTGRSLSLWSELLEAAASRQALAGRPQAATPWPAWPWLAGSGAGMSWAPLAQAWWLGPSVTFWAPLADWGTWSRGSFPVGSSWNGAVQLWPSRTQSSDAAHPKPGADFASYRSAGGHAAAQVIVPAAAMAGVTATAGLSPVQTMLCVWRAAL